MLKVSITTNIILLIVIFIIICLIQSNPDKKITFSKKNKMKLSDLLPKQKQIDSLRICFFNTSDSTNQSKTYRNKNSSRIISFHENQIKNILYTFKNSYKMNIPFTYAKIPEGNYNIELFSSNKYYLINCYAVNYFSTTIDEKKYSFHNEDDDFYFRFLRPLSCN